MGRETENKIVYKKNDTVCLKAGEKGSGLNREARQHLMEKLTSQQGTEHTPTSSTRHGPPSPEKSGSLFPGEGETEPSEWAITWQSREHQGMSRGILILHAEVRRALPPWVPRRLAVRIFLSRKETG